MATRITDIDVIVRSRVNKIMKYKQEKAAIQLAEELSANSPWRTGNLSRRWKASTAVDGKSQVYNDSGYADYVNNRTGYIDRTLRNFRFRG